MNEQSFFNRNTELLSATQQGSRTIDYCGFQLLIENDVFPPALLRASGDGKT